MAVKEVKKRRRPVSVWSRGGLLTSVISEDDALAENLSCIDTVADQADSSPYKNSGTETDNEDDDENEDGDFRVDGGTDVADGFR